jgi:hypothetical protein
MKSSAEKDKFTFRHTEECTTIQNSRAFSHRISNMTIQHLMTLTQEELMNMEFRLHRYHGFRQCSSPISISFQNEDSTIHKEVKLSTEICQQTCPIPALPAPMLPVREMSDPFDPINLNDKSRVEAAWMSLQSLFLVEEVMFNNTFTDFDVAANYPLDFPKSMIPLTLDFVS